MTEHRTTGALSDADRAAAQRLLDEIGRSNHTATGITEYHELLRVETDDDGQLIAGIYGWSWGGTCWIEALWVREDMRKRGVGTRLLAAVEAEARRDGVSKSRLTPTASRPPASVRAAVSRSWVRSPSIRRGIRSC